MIGDWRNKLPGMPSGLRCGVAPGIDPDKVFLFLPDGYPGGMERVCSMTPKEARVLAEMLLWQARVVES